MTLRRQMILLIAAPTLLIYIAILGVTAFLTYHEAKESRQQMMIQLASSYAAQFDGQLREAAQIARTTADFIENAGVLRDELRFGRRLRARDRQAGGRIVRALCIPQ
jgi:hypothetical protein